MARLVGVVISLPGLKKAKTNASKLDGRKNNGN